MPVQVWYVIPPRKLAAAYIIGTNQSDIDRPLQFACGWTKMRSAAPRKHNAAKTTAPTRPIGRRGAAGTVTHS